MKYKPKTKPYPHQSRAVLKAVRHGSYGVFMEPRTGKSKVAIDYVGVQHLRGLCSRVVVIVPLCGMDVWLYQLKLHAPYSYSVEDSEYIYHNPSDAEVHFLLINTEKTWQRYRKTKSSSYIYPYIKEIEDFDPDVVIDDESHRHKRAGGVGAQATWRLVERLRKRRASDTPYVLLLSGTPNPKGWIDLFAQFRIMDSSIFGTSKADFEEEHVVYGHGKRQYTIIRYRHKKELLRKIRAHSITVTSEQAGLANKQFWQRIPVDLPPKARQIYNEMAEDLITKIDGGIIEASNAGVKRMRLLQITGGFTTDGRQIHGAKLKALKDYLSDLAYEEEQAVVYCRFLPEVQACAEVAKKLGFHTTAITGKTSRSDRTRAIVRLQARSSEPHLLVFQVQTGSLSIELTAAAEVILYSLPDSWELYWQILMRVCGPNQTRPVRYSHILARNTADLSVLGALRRKEDGHGEMMQTPRRFLMGLK